MIIKIKMVSYMKKMIWGDPGAQQAGGAQGAAAAEESKDQLEGNTTFTGRVTPDMIMKEGWLFKRSRYLQQWKK